MSPCGAFGRRSHGWLFVIAIALPENAAPRNLHIRVPNISRRVGAAAEDALWKVAVSLGHRTGLPVCLGRTTKDPNTEEDICWLQP